MIDSIRDFFEKHIKAAEVKKAAGAPDAVRVASAALLIEMTRMDGGITEVERDRVMRAVEKKFALPAEETAELLRLAEEEAQQATDYFQFTSLIKDHMSPEQKERLIEHLWEVAYADGELHPYEEHLVRKLADLLYVPHQSFIAAKQRVRTRR